MTFKAQPVDPWKPREGFVEQYYVEHISRERLERDAERKEIKKEIELIALELSELEKVAESRGKTQTGLGIFKTIPRVMNERLLLLVEKLEEKK